jgi:hypothetical protein
MTRTGCHRHTDVPAVVPDGALAGLRSLERAVATAGGQEAFDAAVTAMLEDARGGVSPRCASGAA